MHLLVLLPYLSSLMHDHGLLKKKVMLYFSNRLSLYTQHCDDTTSLMTTKSWLSSQQEEEIFLFFKTCSLVMVPT
jgi:hypothetical protein